MIPSQAQGFWLDGFQVARTEEDDDTEGPVAAMRERSASPSGEREETDEQPKIKLKHITTTYNDHRSRNPWTTPSIRALESSLTLKLKTNNVKKRRFSKVN